MSNDNSAAATSTERPLSDDTIFIANLPADFNRAALQAWCDENFTKPPKSVGVRKPRARDGAEVPNVRYGFLRFDDKELAGATLDLLLSDTDPFMFEGNRVEAMWAKAPRERQPRQQRRGGENNNGGGDGGEGGGGAGGRRGRNRRGRKNNTGDAGNSGGGGGGGGGDGGEGGGEGGGDGKKKRRRRRRKKTGAGGAGGQTEGGDGGNNEAEEEEPEPDMTGRIYCKGFESEATLRTELEKHGTITTLELKEVRRGPGTGSVYAFATFDSEESANAAVAALGVEEGAEVPEGQLFVQHAKPRARRRRRRNAQSIRLEEPSQLDLCCRNLPYSLDDAGLRELFKDYSTVESARIITRAGRSRGYGFVHFGDNAEATAAQTALDGTEIGEAANGTKLVLRLDFATSAPRPIQDPEGAAAAAAAGKAAEAGAPE